MKFLIKQLLVGVSFLIYYCFYISDFLEENTFLLVTFFYLFLISVIYITPNIRWKRFPIEGFFLLYAIIVIGFGMMNAVEKVRSGWWSNYNIKLSIPAFYCSVFLTIFVFVLLSRKIMKKKSNSNTCRIKKIFIDIDLKSLKTISLLLFFSGVISTIFILSVRGTAPIFDPSLRFKFFEQYTFLNYTMLYALVLAQIFSFILYKNRLMHILEFGTIFIISSGILLLTSARGIFLMPIFVMFLIGNYIYRKVKTYKLVLFIVFAILSVAFIYNVRERSGFSFLGRIKYFYRFFSEFFDFALLVQIVPREMPYTYTENLYAGLMFLLPKEVWNLFGIDKMWVLENNPGAKISNFLGRTTGTRLSIFGDAYFFAGGLGVIFWAVVIGLLMNKFLKDVYESDLFRKRILGIMGCSVLIFIIPFELGVGFIPRILLYYVYPLILFKVLEKRNVQKNQTTEMA